MRFEWARRKVKQRVATLQGGSDLISLSTFAERHSMRFNERMHHAIRASPGTLMIAYSFA